jgi:hypothetical protein
MAEPRDHLQILAFFHFAVGAMIAMVALVPLALFFAGSELSAPGAEEVVRTEGARVAHLASFGCGLVALAVGLAVGATVAFAGRFLLARRGFRFCLAAAVLACLFVPIGTALGAVTLTLLLRPDIRALFADA